MLHSYNVLFLAGSLLLNLNIKLITTAQETGCDSNARLIVALDSSKMTTKVEFNHEKNIVSKVLRLVPFQYALVVYTGDEAWVYKDFGQDPSNDGLSLENLTYYHSKSYGFTYKKLFSLDYNSSPDCLWLLRNNHNYTYPTTSGLPDKPMGYDVPIPKIVLAFGKGFSDPIKNLTYISDLQFNGFDIDSSLKTGYVNTLQKSLCSHCKVLRANKSTRAPTAQTTYVSITMNPTTERATTPTSNVSNADQLKEDYQKFVNYNISKMDLTDEKKIHDYVTEASSILRRSSLFENSDGSTNMSVGLHVLDALERFCVSVGNTMVHKKTMNLRINDMLIDILAVNMTSFKGITLGSLFDGDGFVRLPAGVFTQNKDSRHGVIVSMVMNPLQAFLEGTTTNSEVNTSLAGKVINVITQPRPTRPLDPPVIIGFKHTKEKPEEVKPSCVFWDTEHNVWATTGCSVKRTYDGNNASVIECQCNHMTHYAVLLSLNDEFTKEAHYQALTVITYVGCSLSIVGVFLTLIIFLCLPVLQSERTRIHCHLCIALGLSQILFLAAGSKELVEHKIACQLYAAFMFYCFMAVFSWMLVEGVHLYQMIIIAFISRSMMTFYYSLGWGLPLVIVAIASAITYQGYGTEHFCWISLNGGTIYAFAVPAGIIIMVNMTVLSLVLRLRVKLEKSSDVHKTVKTGARVSLVLLPLLGMTWVFGYFTIIPNVGVVFQYLFAITNSLQGFMVFLFHCVGNSEVRREFHRKAEHWYLTRNISSNTISMVSNKITPSQDDAADISSIRN